MSCVVFVGVYAQGKDGTAAVALHSFRLASADKVREALEEFGTNFVKDVPAKISIVVFETKEE